MFIKVNNRDFHRRQSLFHKGFTLKVNDLSERSIYISVYELGPTEKRGKNKNGTAESLTIHSHTDTFIVCFTFISVMLTPYKWTLPSSSTTLRVAVCKTRNV